MGYLLNIVLRASLVFFTLDSLINATDERYAGKGLSICNVLIVLVRLRGTRPEPDLP